MHLTRPARLVLALPLAVALLVVALVGTAAADPDDLRSLSTRDAKEFGQKIEEGIAARNGAPMDSAVHIEALLERVMDGLDGADAIKDDLRAALKETLVGPEGVAQTVIRELGAPTSGATYKFLRARRVRGDMQLQFRLNTPTGHNYHEYLVARTKDGDPVITDLYLFLGSEWYSQACRRLVLVSLAEEAKARLRKGGQRDLVEAANTLEKMTEAAREERYTEAVNLLEQLPRSLRTDKAYLALRVIWAQHVNEQKWELALAEFRGRCPNEPGAALAGLPLDLQKGRYRDAYEALDIVDRAVGGDPYLYVQRAVVASHEQDWNKVSRFAQKAVNEEPGLHEAWELLIAVPLLESRYSEVVKQLTAAESKKQDVDRIIARVRASYGDAWAQFAVSGVYKRWQQDREKRQNRRRRR